MSSCASAGVGGQAPADRPQSRWEIAVTDRGFEPAHIAVNAQQPIVLVFTRVTPKACLKEVVVYLDDSHTVRRELPIGQPVELRVTFSKSGDLGYSCGMSMYGGRVDVR